MTPCRCPALIYIDYPINPGKVRRDCATCGKTWGFPLWLGVVDESMNYGTPANGAQVKEAERRHREAAAFQSQMQDKKRRAAMEREMA